MKAFIDADAAWSHTLSPGVTDAEREDFHESVKEWCAVATEMCCLHQVHYTDSGADVRVYQQKCSLTDVDMNTLFDEFLSNLFEISLEHAPLGGRGCEFGIHVKLEPRKFT